jgi:hypothetical protein
LNNKFILFPLFKYDWTRIVCRSSLSTYSNSSSHSDSNRLQMLIGDDG